MIAIFFICKNPLKHKTKLIILNIAQLLLGNIFNIIFGIVNIVILTRKTNDVEEAPKVEEEKTETSEAEEKNVTFEPEKKKKGFFARLFGG